MQRDSAVRNRRPISPGGRSGARHGSGKGVRGWVMMYPRGGKKTQVFT